MSAARESFPWRRLMHLGLGVLRLPPDAFWRMTPRELMAAFEDAPGGSLPRTALDQLMQRFPDKP